MRIIIRLRVLNSNKNWGVGKTFVTLGYTTPGVFDDKVRKGTNIGALHRQQQQRLPQYINEIKTPRYTYTCALERLC